MAIIVYDFPVPGGPSTTIILFFSFSKAVRILFWDLFNEMGIVDIRLFTDFLG